MCGVSWWETLFKAHHKKNRMISLTPRREGLRQVAQTARARARLQLEGDEEKSGPEGPPPAAATTDTTGARSRTAQGSAAATAAPGARAPVADHN